MAIKVLSPIETPYGISLPNLIITIKDGYRIIPKITQQGKLYEVSTYMYYYADRNKKPLFDEPLKINVTQDQLGNIYPLLYAHIKVRYPNSIEY